MYKLFFLFFFLPFQTLAQTANDTLLIGKNQIVFLTITQAEYDSLASLEDSEGIEEVIGDFNYYSRKVAELYDDSLNIDTQLSTARLIRVKTANIDTVINRDNLSHIVLFIANNGEKFILEEGVFTDHGFKDFIKRNMKFNKE